jgi:O-antigen/teichoic acid export membrane protein
VRPWLHLDGDVGRRGADRRPFVLILLGRPWISAYGGTSAASWVALCAVSYFAATLAQHRIVRSRISGEIGAGPSEYETTAWLRASFAMLLVNAAQVIRMNTDLILVGAMLGPVEVGVYTAAVRAATLVSFALTVASLVAQPRMAAMHAQGRWRELRKFVGSTIRSNFVASFLLGGGLAVFGERVPGFFGSEFVGGYQA